MSKTKRSSRNLEGYTDIFCEIFPLGEALDPLVFTAAAIDSSLHFNYLNYTNETRPSLWPLTRHAVSSACKRVAPSDGAIQQCALLITQHIRQMVALQLNSLLLEGIEFI